MAQPAVGLASGYLHRSGDLGRSHPRRWTHTVRAASAGAAGKRSTPGHWNKWNTEACRLLQTGLGERKGKFELTQKHHCRVISYTAQF